jgi:YHYH protein
MKKLAKTTLICFLATIFVSACSSDDSAINPNGGTTTSTGGTGTTTTGGTTTTTGGTDYSTIMTKAFTDYGAKSVSSVTVDGDYLVVKCTGVPDHKSPYFKGSAWESTLYVNDTRSSFKQAPGSYVAAFSYTFKIPKSPLEASTKRTLGTATIGVALNGVPLFNQYAAGNTMIAVGTGEYVSFDLYGGHPAPTLDYHYHIEPNFITTAKGSDALIGYLLDGFPVYGSKENGKTLVSSDLDAYHGHTSKTTEYPNGIYHYHTTGDAPFINGNGFFGTAGTWTK